MTPDDAAAIRWRTCIHEAAHAVVTIVFRGRLRLVTVRPTPAYNGCAWATPRRPFLLAGEQVYGVLDCKGGGTGFVVLTDRRLMFYDKVFLRNRKALTTVPYSMVTSVSAIDEGGLLRSSSTLVVKTGSDAFEFEFHGGEKAQWAYQAISGSVCRV